MSSTSKKHWEAVYGTKLPDAVSWYQPHLMESLKYVQATGLGAAAAIIDVGGGESTLVDDLLAAGCRDLTLLEISETALDVCRDRLGAKGAGVQWLAADVLSADLPTARFDIWHDRAVFHFLTSDADRRRYVALALRAIRPGGYAIVGTFGPEGPEKCSGLNVARYDSAALHGEFGAPFELLASSIEDHHTPWGARQQFVYCFCRRAPQ